MNGHYALSPKEEKICKAIGTVIGVAIVAIPLVALISSDLTLGDVLAWCMQAFGWFLIGSVAVGLAVVLLTLAFIWALPYLWIAFGVIGILLLVNGLTLGGILCLAVAGVIGFLLS